MIPEAAAKNLIFFFMDKSKTMIKESSANIPSA
jgi:hypothetical protein